MKKKEVLKKLDELVPQLREEVKWTKIEATAAVVQTYRSYKKVGSFLRISPSSVYRRCKKFIHESKK